MLRGHMRGLSTVWFEERSARRSVATTMGRAQQFQEPRPGHQEALAGQYLFYYYE